MNTILHGYMLYDVLGGCIRRKIGELAEMWNT